MTDHVITREGDGAAGRYVIRHGQDEAELTFTILSPSLVCADHTGVPDAFRGTGAGVALVTRMVEEARAQGFRIVPLCPFVDAQRQKHPEWADAFQA